MSAPARRLPVGRLVALAALLTVAVVVMRPARTPAWRTVVPGAELAILDGGHWCRAGSANLAVLRLDPARVRLRVRHCSQLAKGEPLSIAGWQRADSATAVFNAGQYYPDLSYMGLLVSDGHVLSSRPHATFQAALVAEHAAGGGGAKVLDLQRHRLDPSAPGWKQVAQSFMLIDESGAIRVRRSDKVANRTVVAEDEHGRLLVVVSEGGYTLFDCADMLKQLPLGVTHAMSMDGGSEAQMVVRSPALRYASFGRWERDGDENGIPGAGTPLPAVIEVLPR